MALLGATISCARSSDPNALVMMIESSPANLDPRVGLDGQSERIDELIFDALLTHDEHLNVQPGLADKWETPDPLTYIFHLHPGVTFHGLLILCCKATYEARKVLPIALSITLMRPMISPWSFT
jgi:peptide/nickel transport system substrate-binding protein